MIEKQIVALDGSGQDWLHCDVVRWVVACAVGRAMDFVTMTVAKEAVATAAPATISS